jgi:hypothetical protein
MFETPKAIIDIMLGAISITSGQRTLETYIEDMKERGQTEKRIQEVTAALKNLNFLNTSTTNSTNSTNSINYFSRPFENNTTTTTTRPFENIINTTTDTNNFNVTTSLDSSDVPKNYICPITSKIMMVNFNF